jgi:hypothetical protein
VVPRTYETPKIKIQSNLKEHKTLNAIFNKTQTFLGTHSTFSNCKRVLFHNAQNQSQLMQDSLAQLICIRTGAKGKITDRPCLLTSIQHNQSHKVEAMVLKWVMMIHGQNPEH